MTDSLLPDIKVAWLFFVIPKNTRNLAAALVDNYVLFEDCLIVDPDADSMGTWMLRHVGAPYRTYVDLDDSIDDVEAVLLSVMGDGRPAFAHWPAHTRRDGEPVHAGYAFTDGNDRIVWAWLETGRADESSRAMRMAGLETQDIETMQDIITSIHRRQHLIGGRQ